MLPVQVHQIVKRVRIANTASIVLRRGIVVECVSSDFL